MKKMIMAMLLFFPLLTGMGYHDPYDQGYGDGYRKKPARSKDPQYMIGWSYGHSRQRDEMGRAGQPTQDQQSALWTLEETPEPKS